MNPVRTVLVPVDLSARSLQAIDSLGGLLGVGDERLHVVVFASINREVEITAREIIDDGAGPVDAAVRESLERIVAAYDKTGMTVSQAYVQSEDAAAGIVDYATHHDVTMIVMTSHGRTGASRWLLGSVAERVVRHSPVPVLVIPVRDAS